MKEDFKKIIIVGAGVAGLTLAYKLGQVGRDVLLIEKENKVGGLARSFGYEGFIFDIGPHRFHTELPEVLDFIYEILGDDYLTIERKSGVWMFGTYFDWPLAAASLMKMPISVLVSVGMDYLKGKENCGGSFEDHITGNYGKTLCNIFFKPYTEKFLGIPSAEISRDWATTGIDRAVIDSTIKMNDLGDLFKSLLSKHKPLTFIYPKSGGISVFAEKLQKKIKRNNGSVLLGAGISEIIVKNGRIQSVIADGETCACDVLVWTGPITEILGLLGHHALSLEYRSLLLYNYQLAHEPRVNYQWCYYGSADIPFNRISTPSLFNPLLAPSGKTGVCAEVTCMKGDRLWESPESMEPAIRNALVKTEVARNENAITGFAVERIANAYPVYTSDYNVKLTAARAISAQFSNLKLLGRTGSFWYNNMDHSIHAALRMYDDMQVY